MLERQSSSTLLNGTEMEWDLFPSGSSVKLRENGVEETGEGEEKSTISILYAQLS